MIYFLIFCVIAFLIVIYLNQYLSFKALYNIEIGQSVKDLENISLTPTIIVIDNRTKLYNYYYLSLFGIIFPAKRIKCVAFTIVDGIIKYANTK